MPDSPQKPVAVQGSSGAVTDVAPELLPYVLIAAGAVVAAVVIGALVKSLTGGGSRITQNNYFR